MHSSTLHSPGSGGVLISRPASSTSARIAEGVAAWTMAGSSSPRVASRLAWYAAAAVTGSGGITAPPPDPRRRARAGTRPRRERAPRAPVPWRASSRRSRRPRGSRSSSRPNRRAFHPLRGSPPRPPARLKPSSVPVTTSVLPSSGPPARLARRSDGGSVGDDARHRPGRRGCLVSPRPRTSDPAPRRRSARYLHLGEPFGLVGPDAPELAPRRRRTRIRHDVAIGRRVRVGSDPFGEPVGQVDRGLLADLRHAEAVEDPRERPADPRPLDPAVQVLGALRARTARANRDPRRSAGRNRPAT